MWSKKGIERKIILLYTKFLWLFPLFWIINNPKPRLILSQKLCTNAHLKAFKFIPKPKSTSEQSFSIIKINKKQKRWKISKAFCLALFYFTFIYLWRINCGEFFKFLGNLKITIYLNILFSVLSRRKRSKKKQQPRERKFKKVVYLIKKRNSNWRNSQEQQQQK